MFQRFSLNLDQNLQNVIESLQKPQNQQNPNQPQNMQRRQIPFNHPSYYQPGYQYYNQIYYQQQPQIQQRRDMERPPQPQVPQQQPIPQRYPPATINTSQFKPSEMKMESLIFQSGRYENKYLSSNKYLQTKIHYGNKQFVFQISDSKPTKENQDQDSNQFSGSHDVQNSSLMTGTDFKLKVEIKFEDINELEINLNENTITIITRQNLKQYRQSESIQKKPGSWIQQEFIQKEDGKYTKIQGKYLKDVLTKHVYHKNYITIAEKIKKCCDGQIVISPQYNIIFYFQQKHFNIIGQMPPPQADTSQTNLSSVANKKDDDIFQNNLKKDLVMNELNDESNISHPQQDNRDLELMFPKVSQEQIGEIKRNIEKKNLNQDEKIKKLFDEFKIKWFRSYSFNPSGDRKNHKCPYFRCSKQFSKPQSLRNHMKKSHPKLSDIDLTIDDYGVFTWSEKALDYCIMLGNIFPQFNKSIIKEMKQRKEVSQ